MPFHHEGFKFGGDSHFRGGGGFIRPAELQEREDREQDYEVGEQQWLKSNQGLEWALG